MSQRRGQGRVVARSVSPPARSTDDSALLPHTAASLDVPGSPRVLGSTLRRLWSEILRRPCDAGLSSLLQQASLPPSRTPPLRCALHWGQALAQTVASFQSGPAAGDSVGSQVRTQEGGA